MDKFNFLQIIQNPDILTTSMRDDLVDIAENYPYFQGVYALLSKLETSPSTINQAAIRTANRNVLKDFLEIQTKKKDKREIINNLDLHTEQVNAFDKFEDLEEQESQTEDIQEFELNELEESKQDFEEEVILNEPISIEEELPHDSEEVEEESVEINKIIEEVTEELPVESEENDLPVFDEPDYLKEDIELDTQINQTDTAKDLPNYEENETKGSFFDSISDDEFPEVNFEENELDFKSIKKSFKNVEENNIQNKIDVKLEQEVPNSIPNTPQKEISPAEKELHYTDYHLTEGEILPPDSKTTVEEIQKSSKKAQYEDYHLTAPQQEAKIADTKITEQKANKQNIPPKEEEKDKPTGSFFDSF